jgi:hypothetical protein
LSLEKSGFLPFSEIDDACVMFIASLTGTCLLFGYFSYINEGRGKNEKK